MPNLLKTTILLLLTACCLQANAQTISAADQKGIEATYNGFMSAFEKLDASAISALLTENAEQVIPDGRLVRGRANIVASMAGYMAFLKTQPKPDRVEQKNLEMQSRYLASDVILSTYKDQTTYYFGDKSKVETTTTSIILHKVNSQWLAELIALTPVVEMPKN